MSNINTIIYAVGVDFKYLLTTFVTLLVFSEMYSIMGNIYTVKSKSNKELPEYDALALIGKILRNILIKIGEGK